MRVFMWNQFKSHTEVPTTSGYLPLGDESCSTPECFHESSAYRALWELHTKPSFMILSGILASSFGLVCCMPRRGPASPLCLCVCLLGLSSLFLSLPGPCRQFLLWPLYMYFLEIHKLGMGCKQSIEPEHWGAAAEISRAGHTSNKAWHV